MLDLLQITKTKRKLVTKTFTDQITHQPKEPQTKVEYNVIDPNQPDQGEKLLQEAAASEQRYRCPKCKRLLKAPLSAGANTPITGPAKVYCHYFISSINICRGLSWFVMTTNTETFSWHSLDKQTNLLCKDSGVFIF